MKRTIAMCALFAAMTAYAVPHLSPSGVGDGTPPKEGAGQAEAQRQQGVLNGLTKSGFMGQAQVDAINKARNLAAQQAAIANAVMKGGNPQAGNMAPMPDAGLPSMGAQPGAVDAGKAGAPQAQQPATPPVEQPKVRLEGTIVGGTGRATAWFDVTNVGAVYAHPGATLPDGTKVVAVSNRHVLLKSKDGKISNLTPW